LPRFRPTPSRLTSNGPRTASRNLTGSNTNGILVV
jgi:hypothetical protein